MITKTHNAFNEVFCSSFPQPPHVPSSLKERKKKKKIEPEILSSLQIYPAGQTK